MTIYFETLFRGIIGFFALLLLGIYLWEPIHPFIDELSVLLAEVLFAILYIANGQFSRGHPSARMVSFIVLIFIQLRLITVYLKPKWLFLGDRASYSTINQTLTYVILGTIFCYAGIAAGSFLAGRRRPKKPLVCEERFYKYAAFATVLCSLIGAGRYLIVGFSNVVLSGENLDFFTRYISRLLNPLVLMVISLIAYRFLEKKSVANRTLHYVNLIIFTGFLTVSGSRAALYEIFILGLVTFPSVTGDFKVRVTTSRILLCLLGLLIIPWTFNYATNTRVSRFAFAYMNEASPVLEQVSRRLSLIENTMFPLCLEEMKLFDISNIVNAKTTLLNSLNRIIPGKPFGTMLFSELGICYMWMRDGCITLDMFGRPQYTAYEWGMWGIAYQLFGYVGGLVFIFLFTAIIAWAIQLCRNRATISSLCFVGLGDYAMQFWVKNLGIDSFVLRFFTFFGVLAVYLFLLRRTVKKPVSRPSLRRPTLTPTHAA